jgi:predicted GNAT family acetyltransferase
VELNVVDVVEEKRYTATVDGHVAFVEYIKAHGIVYLTHTEVPKALEGKGVGKALVLSVLTRIKEEGATLAPLCPFVAAFLTRHPEWKSLLAKNYNV